MIQYQALRELDLITPVSHMIRAKKMTIDKTKSKIIYCTTKDTEMPWMLVRKDPARDCTRWLEIYFQYYRIIPSKCFGCMKIVFRPESLEECFMVGELQKESGYYSKFGMEYRNFCPHLYGAFWYVPLGATMVRAQQMHRAIKESLEAKLGREVELMLKRACTEMELGFGDSFEWGDEAPKEQMRLEHLLDATFEPEDDKHAQQTSLEQSMVHRRMIEYAWEKGDKTYKIFTGNQPLYPPSRDYSTAQTLEVIK